MEEIQGGSWTQQANGGKDWSPTRHSSLTNIFQISKRNNKVKPDSKVLKSSIKNPEILTSKSRNDSGYESPRPSPQPFSPADGTPPLCQCGRRSRKRQVYSVGPNTGRIFLSCTLKGRNTKAGCSFFSWASS